ncbi:MAG: PilZ domain-containing protein [Deltaproteobacteria bacterium]|nr:PilZ domain-containing protein [Deltaproteobacteria bacterium]
MTVKQKKILISETVQELLTIDDNFSEREGFTIHVGKDCAELLSQTRGDTPDIIFASPSCNQDDFTFCRLLREDNRISSIPVVTIVDSSKLAETNHVLHDRPADVLFTPINTHLFLASARRILGLSHRSFSRRQTSQLIHFGLNEEILRTACAFNLSSGGVFIATDHLPKIDETVFIQLDLTTAESPILCQGVVTWHNHSEQPSHPEMPGGFGLQFASLKVSDLFALRNFIKGVETPCE